jgi:hypothetical protein
MSTEITEAFVKQFRSDVIMLSQQKDSRLKKAVRNESQKGESQFFDRIGSVTATKKAGRHSDTPLIDTPHSRRRVTLSDYEHADLIDHADKVRLLIDPTSPYSRAFQMAFGRAMDDEIIDAALGSAYGGVDGGTSVAHPNSQKLAAVNAAGTAGDNMNVELLRRAKQKLDEQEVDPSIRRYIAHESSQVTNLLEDSNVTSSDFNTVKALVQGEVNQYMGFEFIRSQRLNTQSGTLNFSYTDGSVGAGSGDADTYRRCFAWAMDGLLLSTGENVVSRISERDDKSYSTQVFMRMSIGSTRLEEEKVVELLCSEA